MSVLKVYSVFDSKVGAFMHPFFMRSRGEALRGWIDAVNDPQTQFNKHPEDFSLMELGEYDERTGKFANEITPVSLGVGVEFIRREPSAQEALPFAQGSKGSGSVGEALKSANA